MISAAKPASPFVPSTIFIACANPPTAVKRSETNPISRAASIPGISSAVTLASIRKNPSAAAMNVTNNRLTDDTCSVMSSSSPIKKAGSEAMIRPYHRSSEAALSTYSYDG